MLFSFFEGGKAVGRKAFASNGGPLPGLEYDKGVCE
jgi:hypothetical protein